MKKVLIVVVVLIGAGAAYLHWHSSNRGRLTTAPQYTGLHRAIDGNDLVSNRDPAATLRLDSAFHYIGGQQFILYGVADTEQHFFVDTTSDNRLKSLYWIQYEAYLPNKRYTYNYDDSPLRLKLGDYEFFTDTEFFEFDPDKKRSRGTDGAMAREFLASKGYAYPKQVAYARLVYLTDQSRQKELMIIYMADLSLQGVTAAQLEDSGTMTARRPEIEQAHLDQIKSTLRVLPLGTSQ